MEERIKYLKLLKESYPTIQSACAKIIALESKQKLPKLTEHFLSDIHGEYEPFLHMLKNASGVIRDKIDNVFSRTLSEEDKNTLATLIYYPKEKLEILKTQIDNMDEWYRVTLYRLVKVCRRVAAK